MPVNTIKDIALKVAENYILTGQDMNDALVDSFNAGEIENKEILKRICELANQNVYLALYNDPNTDKSNIRFDIADYSKLKPEIQKSESAMETYKTAPNDFRSLLSVITNSSTDEIKQPKTSIKLAEINKVAKLRDVLKAFISDVESLGYHEMKEAEDAFEKMSHHAKLMIANGESLGDIAKIAARHIQEQGMDATKIAMAYEAIHNILVESGFKVKTDFTKLSSYKINKKSEMLPPIDQFNMAIEKVAGITEMHSNLSKTLNVFNKVLMEELKNRKK